MKKFNRTKVLFNTGTKVILSKKDKMYKRQALNAITKRAMYED